MSDKRGPTPWKLYPAEETSPAVICDADDCPVVEVYDTKGAGWAETGERVLRAVNNHDALVAAVEAARHLIEGWSGKTTEADVRRVLRIIHEALAAAAE